MSKENEKLVPVGQPRLVMPLDSPWIAVDSDYDSLEIYDANGGFVCTPHGETLGEVCDRAELIAAAPTLLIQYRELESALRRLLDAYIPRPLGGIIDDEERRIAAFSESVERGEARQHAREVLFQHNDLALAPPPQRLASKKDVPGG